MANEECGYYCGFQLKITSVPCHERDGCPFCDKLRTRIKDIRDDAIKVKTVVDQALINL